MSLRSDLTAEDILVEARSDGLYPTPRLQAWWRDKTQGLAKRYAMMDVPVADPEGRPSVQLMGLYARAFGRNVFPAQVVMFRNGRGTAEFLFLANG